MCYRVWNGICCGILYSDMIYLLQEISYSYVHNSQNCQWTLLKWIYKLCNFSCLCCLGVVACLQGQTRPSLGRDSPGRSLLQCYPSVLPGFGSIFTYFCFPCSTLAQKNPSGVLLHESELSTPLKKQWTWPQDLAQGFLLGCALTRLEN